MLIDSLTRVSKPSTHLHLRVAWLCGAVLFLEGYDIAAVGYAIPSLVDAWKIHPSAFTQVLTLGNVGLMIGSLSAGILGDRLGRKPVLIACALAFGMFSLLSGFASSTSQLEALRFLTGLGLGGGLPLALALASDFAPDLSKGKLVILMSSAVPIGFSVGGLLTSWIVEALGWQAIFVIGGLLPIVVAPVLGMWLPESTVKHPPSQRRNEVTALFQDGLASRSVFLWAINALSYLTIYFILLWLPAILHGTGMNASRATLGTTIYGLGVIASPVLAAVAADLLGIERVLSGAILVGAVCLLSIGLVGPHSWLFPAFLCGVGIGGGCQAGINSLSALAYPPAIRSTGAGWALGAGRVGTIAGPLLGGLLMRVGFSAQKMFVAVSIPAFGAAFLMATFGRIAPQPATLANTGECR